MSNTPEFRATVSVSGRYKFLRRKAHVLANGDILAGEVVEETPWCKNILTLYYFNQAHTSNSIQPWGCVVGTGNATPLETNTTLASYLAQTTTIQTTAWTKNWTVSPRYTKLSRTYRFGQGVAAGNVAEVGITLASSGINGSTPIISRALVVDGGGTPTTITVLADEFLDVVWECTWYVPEDVTGSFNMTIDGVVTAFTYTVRAVDMNTARWGAGATNTFIGANYPIYSPLSGNFSNGFHSCAVPQTTLAPYDSGGLTHSASNRVINVTSAAYVANSKQREHTLYFGLNEANIAIQSVYVSMGGSQSSGVALGAFQLLFSPAVNKVATKLFEIKIVMSLANAP